MIATDALPHVAHNSTAENRRKGLNLRDIEHLSLCLRCSMALWARSSLIWPGRGLACDRAKMYWYLGSLQWCWAHLKRDFQAMIDSGDPRAKHLGCRLRHATCELFEHRPIKRG